MPEPPTAFAQPAASHAALIRRSRFARLTAVSPLHEVQSHPQIFHCTGNLVYRKAG